MSPGRGSVAALSHALRGLDYFLLHCDDALRGRVAACRDQMAALHGELEAMQEAGEFDELDERAMREEVDACWERFEQEMVKWYGCRAPVCLWCREVVYMALQGPTAGGVWTTEEADEGPCSEGLDGPGTRCPVSPDGKHACFKTEAWLEDGEEAER